MRSPLSWTSLFFQSLGWRSYHFLHVCGFLYHSKTWHLDVPAMFKNNTELTKSVRNLQCCRNLQCWTVIFDTQHPITKTGKLLYRTSLKCNSKDKFTVSSYNVQHHLLAFHKPDKSFTNCPKIETAIEFIKVVSTISWRNFNTFLLQDDVSIANVAIENFSFAVPFYNNLQIHICIYI